MFYDDQSFHRKIHRSWIFQLPQRTILPFCPIKIILIDSR